MRRLRPALTVLLAVLLLPRPAAAQEEPPRAWRGVTFAAAGAAALAFGAQFAREGHSGAFCADRTCLTVVGVTLGGAIGFLLGSDLDERARARWVPAVRLSLPYGSARVPGLVRLAPLPGGVGALADGGVSLVDARLDSRVLASASRVRDLALLRGSTLLALAAEPGLLAVPIQGGAVDTLLRESVSAVAAVDDGRLVAAGRGALRQGSVVERGGRFALEQESEREVEYVARALRVGEGRLWVLADSVLEVRDPRSLAPVGSVGLGAFSNDLALSGRLAVVALGAAGVAVVDISDAARPRVVATLTEMTRADGVAMAGTEAYVAAGAQGLFVYDLSDPASPRLAGVRPDLGLAVDVSVSDGAVWVLDRRDSRVLRIEGAGTLSTRSVR